MPTGRICHTHCPSGGGWGWLIAVIAAVAVLGAGARAAAPALGRLVHDVLLWATVAAVSVSMAAIGGYIAWSALRGPPERRRNSGPGPEAADAMWSNATARPRARSGALFRALGPMPKQRRNG